tara:strand:+ start:792 stop:2201 length:1410 start_codon:yes stop_codon:yes gene_type:complete
MDFIATFKTNKLFYSYFVIGLLLFSVYYIDIWHTPNPISRALPVLTFNESETLEITKYAEVGLDKSKVGEKYFSDKAPLPTLITIPFYELADAIGLSEWKYLEKEYKGAPKWYLQLSSIIFLGSILTACIPFVLMILISFNISTNYLFKPTLIVLAFFGSFLFVFNGTFFNHLFAGLFLVLSVFYLKNKPNPFLSGLFAGMAFLSEYTFGILFVLIPLMQFLTNKKDIVKWSIKFGLGLIPALLIMGWYNYYTTGNPFEFIFYFTDYEEFSKGIKQNYGFNHPTVDSVLGLLISPYMGLFIYCPALIYYLIGIKRNQELSYKNPVLIIFVAFFILVSSYFIWWGGYSWGPRYLLGAACLIVTYAAANFDQFKMKWLVAGVLFLSFLHNWSAKITQVFLVPDRMSPQGEASFPFKDVVLKAFNEETFNQNNLLTQFFKIDPLKSGLIFLLLFILWVVGLEIIYRKKVLKL